MKRYFIAIVILLIFNQLYAQKIEISGQAYSGLFHYAGNGSASTSIINQGSTPGQDYTQNPYGNKNAFSYGAGLQAQHVSKSGFIIGLGADYEILKSKVAITGYNPQTVIMYTLLPYYPVPIPANGSSFLQDRSIDLSPYLGYRLKFKSFSIDMLPGMDIGFNLSSYDNGKATSANPPSNQVPVTYQTNFKRPDPPTDIRLRFGLAGNYKRMAVTASYAHGLTNYEKDMIGSNANTHSELIRFGIAYKLCSIN